MKQEANLRWQAVIGVLVFLLAVYLRLPVEHLVLIVLTGALILSLEMVNTALEILEDVVHPHHHEAVRRSKDVAAGAVLISSVASCLIGILLFVPPLFKLVVTLLSLV